MKGVRVLPPIGDPRWTDSWTVGRDGLRMEILETATRKVWLCQEPVTMDEYAALRVPDGFVRSGIGLPVADVAYFRRSPGATADGPLDVMDVDGHRFAYVARPGAPEPEHEHALVLPVYKSHTVLYDAGRTIELLDLADGWSYVPQTDSARDLGGSGREPRARRVADHWAIRPVTLEADLVVEVPYPARVCFFADGSSFQGPVRLGQGLA